MPVMLTPHGRRALLGETGRSPSCSPLPGKPERGAGQETGRSAKWSGRARSGAARGNQLFWPMLPCTGEAGSFPTSQGWAINWVQGGMLEAEQPQRQLTAWQPAFLQAVPVLASELPPKRKPENSNLGPCKSAGAQSCSCPQGQPHLLARNPVLPHSLLSTGQRLRAFPKRGLEGCSFQRSQLAPHTASHGHTEAQWVHLWCLYSPPHPRSTGKRAAT